MPLIPASQPELSTHCCICCVGSWRVTCGRRLGHFTPCSQITTLGLHVSCLCCDRGQRHAGSGWEWEGRQKLTRHCRHFQAWTPFLLKTTHSSALRMAVQGKLIRVLFSGRGRWGCVSPMLSPNTEMKGKQKCNPTSDHHLLA